MAKKPKESLRKSSNDNNSNKESSSPSNANSGSDIFKALFGEIPQDNAQSVSLFSESNPFRRKSQNHFDLGPGEKDADKEGTLVNSDSAELSVKEKKKKRHQAEESSNPEPELFGESKKPKREKESKGKEAVDVGLDASEGQNKGGNMNLFPQTCNNLVAKTGRNSVENDNNKKKRKRNEVEAEYEAKRYGVIDNEKKTDEKEGCTVVGEKRKKIDNPEDSMVEKEGFDDENKLLRTVFVGNLPLKIKKKSLMKEFAKFGEVESVRIRSVPIVDSKVPRKGAVIKKQINENADSVHAYIVFQTEESAQASLAHNMAVVGGNHIRVDRACPPRKKLKGHSSPLYDNKRTVFVGNLPFDVKDEEIYQLFCGIKNLEDSVEAVRVIRDPGTSLGKGIAYVLFKTRDAANNVVKKRNLKLRDRQLRLSNANPNATPSKRKNSSPPELGNSSAKKLAVESRTPGSENKVKPKANMSYQGLRASKSGSQKKSHIKTSAAAKSKSGPATEQKQRKEKRPAVAARKLKALRAAGASKQVGEKRKLGNRTPGSGGQRKKPRH